MNPYTGQDFFGFFHLLMLRIFGFFSGNIQEIASDEIQCLVLIFIGISMTFLGSFLVFKQMTMLANALSHTVLLGISLVAWMFSLGELHDFFYSIKLLLIASAISALLTVFMTQFFRGILRVSEDASIGVVFTTLFAAGILSVTLLTKNLHLGTDAIMGNIDALHIDDVKISLYLCLSTIAVGVLLFRGLYVSCFDEQFARSIGIPVTLLNYVLMVLTAACSITAFRAVGVLLFLALLVGPVLISMQYTNSFKKLIPIHFLVTTIASIVSVALSRHILTVFKTAISTSGLLVVILLVWYLIGLLFSRNFSNRKYE